MKIDLRNWYGSWKNNIKAFLFITLIFSIIYAIVKIIISPVDVVIGTDIQGKSHYVLILIQCLLGLVVMMIPSIIEQKKRIDIPDSIEILYFVFLFAAIVLGEVRDFYNIFPYWDMTLHAFSSGMLGAFGFSLVTMLNDVEKVKIDLSPFFIALFAFCFALSVGSIWEIYEYAIDGIFSLNMQKYALENGTVLFGHQALSDTMNDIFVDALGALFMSIIGYSSVKRRYPKRHLL
jgi:hypothetical protein